MEGKAEAVLDTLYSMTHCKSDQWTDEKGSDCYMNTVKDLDKDIGQCCAGYEHIVLFEMEATCDAAVLPILDPIRQFLKPAWITCQRHPEQCTKGTKKYDTCMREAQKLPHMPHKPHMPSRQQRSLSRRRSCRGGVTRSPSRRPSTWWSPLTRSSMCGRPVVHHACPTATPPA